MCCHYQTAYSNSKIRWTVYVCGLSMAVKYLRVHVSRVNGFKISWVFLCS
jgi:hypothetical protein